MKTCFLLLAPALVSFGLGLSPLAASSSVSSSSSPVSLDEELKRSFKIDVSSYKETDFVCFGCLWNTSSSSLRMYGYLPGGSFNYDQQSLVESIDRLSKVTGFVENRPLTTSISSVMLSDSIAYDDSTGYKDDFKSYPLEFRESSGDFYCWDVKGFKDYRLSSLNRWCVNSIDYSLDFSFSVVVNSKPVTSSCDGSVNFVSLDVNTETQCSDDGNTMKLVGNYSQANVITSKKVAYLNTVLNKNYSLNVHYDLVNQSYYCAFNTDIALEELQRVQFCYYSSYYQGALDLDSGLPSSSSSTSFSDPLYKNIVLEKEQKTLKTHDTLDVFHFFDKEYSFSTIEKVSSNDGWSEDVSSYSWVFRFENDIYKKRVLLKDATLNGTVVGQYEYSSSCLLNDSTLYNGIAYDNNLGFCDVSGVQILKLWDNTSTGLVEYSVLDKPTDSTGEDTDSDPDVPVESWLDKFSSWFMGNLPMSVIIVLAVIACIPLIITFLPQVLKLLFYIVKYVILALWWIVKLPFVLIKKIVEAAKNRG